ncbi:ABC transporter permease [Candidatus Micrarchaeota archaeon]|nr:ABC transporter permease [Candidatus Micrarchaeota archaeon]
MMEGVFYELFMYAVRGLKRRKTRTWLTLIAIVIGVLLFVTMVSLGEGLRSAVSKQVEKFGADNIIILPGKGSLTELATSNMFRGRLWEKDVKRIESLPGVEEADGLIASMRATVSYKGKTLTTPVYGVTSSRYFDYVNIYKIYKGRLLSDNDKRVALVGYKFANDLFDKRIDVGSFIYINGIKYRVVGILDYIGGMNEREDEVIYIPYDEVREFAKNELEDKEVFMIYVHTNGDVNTTVKRIRQTLRESHRIPTGEDDDFTIMTSQSIRSEIDSILGRITLFLGVLSGISLVVGTVGIMNTMYMVIIERTREIGTLKAVGARNVHILIAIVMESVLIAMIGGIFGVTLGVAVSEIINMFGLPSTVSIELASYAIVISLFIGVIGGIIPGRRAVRLDPTEALRYE